MRHGAIPTVKIASADFASGFVVINADEFDPAAHVPFDPAPKPAKPGTLRLTPKGG